MTKEDLRIVFMGTPEFAVPSLAMLAENGFNICGVITQPDRPKGRGHRLEAPPVKKAALAAGVPVFQERKISSPDGLALLERLAPSLLITVAYGQILSQQVLDAAPLGCINVHASLLPKYRGAAPIQQAVMHGEAKTGITTMRTVLALDAGPILEQDTLAITEGDTGGSVAERLSQLGARTLLRTLEKLLDGTLEETAQRERDATYFPMFKKGDGEICWKAPSAQIVNFVRGLNPAPGAFFLLDGERIRVHRAKAARTTFEGIPGEILVADDKDGLLVATQDGAVWLEEIQRQGARAMDAKASLRGRGLPKGQILGRCEA